MTTLIDLCQHFVSEPQMHCRWLNTLSMMENAGARKIAASEHPIDVDFMVLKHASEEFRHAYFLKKLIGRIDETACPTYASEYILAPQASRYYLHQLDIAVCRMLLARGFKRDTEMKKGAYLLVTYAIEVRADELYGSYQTALDEAESRVNVKSIIAEEEGHLAEMQSMLVGFHPNWQNLAEAACAIEESLFDQWTNALSQELVLSKSQTHIV